MEHKIQVIRPDAYQVSTWSGGTTTQIAIFPPQERYTDRNFLWRVSSASVNLAESDFTALPDYIRLICTIQGEIDLSHNEGPWLHLRPFELHRFDGADRTCSRGLCTDFNLMLRKEAAMDGDVLCAQLDIGQEKTLAAIPGASVLAYCVSGALKVSDGENAVTFRAGESSFIENSEQPIRFLAEGEPSVALICQIWKESRKDDNHHG